MPSLVVNKNNIILCFKSFVFSSFVGLSLYEYWFCNFSVEISKKKLISKFYRKHSRRAKRAKIEKLWLAKIIAEIYETLIFRENFTDENEHIDFIRKIKMFQKSLLEQLWRRRLLNQSTVSYVKSDKHSWISFLI